MQQRLSANRRSSTPAGSTDRPSTVVSSAVSRRPNSSADSSPISRRWIGVFQETLRDNQLFRVRENDAGSIPSAASHASIESRTGVVSTPP
jgi:hypothetical protein